MLAQDLRGFLCLVILNLEHQRSLRSFRPTDFRRLRRSPAMPLLNEFARLSPADRNDGTYHEELNTHDSAPVYANSVELSDVPQKRAFARSVPDAREIELPRHTRRKGVLRGQIHDPD